MAMSPVVVLVVRILTFVCLLASLILITTDSVTLPPNGNKIKFNKIYPYRYLVATLILGLAYTLLQTAFAISQACTGKRVGGERSCVFDFFADNVVSYLVASGAAACFGVTQELKKRNTVEKLYADLGSKLHMSDTDKLNVQQILDDMDKFINRGNVAARVCLIGFVFAATSSVFSSYALPKRA
ncbi:PREDICTED: CASP-like protein PIMP1 [Ipomoea nil]|uniref:CASP-like protein PIMP1 n=1 Tax=Ipomoea nil TaxID=35883 RepID=UPI000901B0F2|nr:PREDICTED: CASP-like protein PIMP1 [Ipomoea nil]